MLIVRRSVGLYTTDGRGPTLLLLLLSSLVVVYVEHTDTWSNSAPQEVRGFCRIRSAVATARWLLLGVAVVCGQIGERCVYSRVVLTGQRSRCRLGRASAIIVMSMLAECLLTRDFKQLARPYLASASSIWPRLT